MLNMYSFTAHTARLTWQLSKIQNSRLILWRLFTKMQIM